MLENMEPTIGLEPMTADYVFSAGIGRCITPFVVNRTERPNSTQWDLIRQFRDTARDTKTISLSSQA